VDQQCRVQSHDWNQEGMHGLRPAEQYRSEVLRREEAMTQPVAPPPDLVYHCSFEGCGYQMFDAAYGDVEDHWRLTHCERSAFDNFGTALGNLGRIGSESNP
jgi:hypothetical protein